MEIAKSKKVLAEAETTTEDGMVAAAYSLSKTLSQNFLSLRR